MSTRIIKAIYKARDAPEQVGVEPIFDKNKDILSTKHAPHAQETTNQLNALLWKSQP